jgi:Uma2 family endonuclease
MGARVYEEYYTYEDYKHWEGEWEIIDGYPYAMSPKPMIKHQQTSGRIFSELDNKSCQECFSAMEIDYKIADDTVVSPDVVFACGEDLGEKYLQKTPQIIFEVLSPSTEKKDRNEKYSLYEEVGVEYYVLVDAELHKAQIYKLHDGTYKLEKELEDTIYTFKTSKCTIAFEFQKIWVKKR